MAEHEVVSHDEWIEARKRLLANEKEFTTARDELSRRRRELPWERVEKTPKGRDEDQLSWAMEWLRRRDEYGA